MKNKTLDKLKNTAICAVLAIFTFGFALSASAETFLPNIQINEDPENITSDKEPVIAVADDGTIYTVWHNETDKSILFSKSIDGGLTFSSDLKINDDVSYPPVKGVYGSDIALDSNGNIYIVWYDYRAWANDSSWTSPVDVYLSKSVDGGLTWSSNVKIPNRSATYYPWQFQPSIAIDQNNGNIYVSFNDYNNYYVSGIYDEGDISVARSTDGGATFESAVKVDDTGNNTTQLWSSVAVDSASGNVYVAFEDLRNGDKDVYLARSTDYGATFEANVLVNDITTNDQVEPSVKVDSIGAVYVAWGDWKNDPDQVNEPHLNDIYIAKSVDNGASFGVSVRVTDEPMNGDYGYVFPPRLSIDDSDTVHIVWHDRRSGPSVCYYDRSSDGGLTFSTDSVINDDTQEVPHSLPRIATNGSEVYITWMDKRNGNNMYDVFFARNGISTHTISGTINYYDGVKFIPNASILLEDNLGNILNTTTTDANGYYEFTDVPSGEDYTVRVEKDDNNSLNGIDGPDITLIARHIVRTGTFNSIFKIIAADVNENGSVLGPDITIIARFIVRMEEALPSGSWKFYSSDATITETNYLTEGMERIINLTEDAINQNFMGIKMGDVNNSWSNE